MRWPSARALTVAVVLATVLAACGVIEGFTACGLHPIEQGATIRIGPAPVAALSCPSEVEVDGRRYTVGVGRWLDESALVLEEYGPITHANAGVPVPTSWSLEGVDPEAILVTTGDGMDPQMGDFWVLHGSVPMPDAMCAYADETDPQSPPECPAR